MHPDSEQICSGVEERVTGQRWLCGHNWRGGHQGLKRELDRKKNMVLGQTCRRHESKRQRSRGVMGFTLMMSSLLLWRDTNKHIRFNWSINLCKLQKSERLSLMDFQPIFSPSQSQQVKRTRRSKVWLHLHILESMPRWPPKVFCMHRQQHKQSFQTSRLSVSHSAGGTHFLTAWLVARLLRSRPLILMRHVWENAITIQC